MRSTASQRLACFLFYRQWGYERYVSLKNSNDVLVNQRISQLKVFTVAGSQTIDYSSVIVVEVIVLKVIVNLASYFPTLSQR